MSTKQSTQATPGEKKPRKERAKKIASPEDLIKGIESQPLEVKVNLLELLKENINKDKETLTAKLALINGIQ